MTSEFEPDDDGDRGEGASGGTQTIRRAMTIVRFVATHGAAGAKLGTIANAMGLSQSTCHRIVRCLVDEGLLKVEQRRYTVGPFAFELSLCNLSAHASVARYSEMVAAIARRTGHTTYLMMRSGGDAVCMQKADGTARMRVDPVDVGQRRPLGVGAGAVALLSALDEAEIERFVASASYLREFNDASPDRVLELALQAKRRGYAVSTGMVFSEVTGIGFLVPDAPLPFVAISITVPTAAIDDKMVVRIAEAMREEIDLGLKRIEQRNAEGNKDPAFDAMSIGVA